LPTICPVNAFLRHLAFCWLIVRDVALQPYNVGVSMTTASIRIRPIRFGFLLDPKDPAALRQVLQINTCLWGGIYNYLLPVPQRAPLRYRDYSYTDLGAGLIKLNFTKGTGPSARQLIHGLLEAFQPDLLVETKPGLARQVEFDKGRVLTLEQFNQEENGQRKYGIDLRSICQALYKEEFRFVQRHPPKVIDPRPTDKKYGTLFAAAFGEFPKAGILAECKQHFRDALDAKEEDVEPETLHELFAQNTLYPLRAGVYQLSTHRRGWSSGPMLFYMDEGELYDIIEYWNLRALGWRITPLPQLLAPKLSGYCEQFMVEAHRPYPPPSNASEDASFLCSRSCAFNEMQAFVSTLKRPNSFHVSIDPRVPRLWEEWGRHADHAQPQVIECETKPAEVISLGGAISIGTIVPSFAQKSGLQRHACTNVIESLPGGAPLIPWQMIDMRFLAGQLRDLSIWVGREGICTTSGLYRARRHLRLPSSLNVFAAWAQKSGLEIELSAAGRVTEQLIDALGGLARVHLIGNEELIKVLDRMANGTLEVEIAGDNQSESPKRKLRKASIPLYQIRQLLSRINNKDPLVAENHFSALLGSNVLILGMEVACLRCEQTTWFTLEQLKTKLQCQRCLREFDFPLTTPNRNIWSYRTQGPFAVEDYANGAYCVAAALQFLADEVSRECTWIPSFKLRSKGGPPMEAEADFGAFIGQGEFSDLTSPVLVFGECKTFGDFDSRDYHRMRSLAKLFPGAIICFCTLRNALTKSEKTRIAALARQGRKSLRTGLRQNPVLVLTGTELLGQFKPESFMADYPSKLSKLVESVFMRRDLQEICDFTQQVHLGIESYHEWLEARHRTRRVKHSKVTRSETSTLDPNNTSTPE